MLDTTPSVQKVPADPGPLDIEGFQVTMFSNPVVMRFRRGVLANSENAFVYRAVPEHSATVESFGELVREIRTSI